MDHHYYGMTVYGWRVGSSVEEVVKALAKDAGAKSIKLNVDIHGGLDVNVCKVHTDIKAEYDIRYYWPVGVQLSDKREYRVTDVKGTHAPKIEHGETGPDWSPTPDRKYYAQCGQLFEFAPDEAQAIAALTAKL